MMKTMVLGALMLSAAAGVAQESRQDVSVSATSVVTPDVHGTGGNEQSATIPPVGFLGSYRYMLTPRSAVEANYSFAQNDLRFNTENLRNVRIHSREQEFSAAYVYSLNFHNFSPFVEGGVGAVFFSPILDFRTNNLDTKRTTALGGLFGGGVAYELSPSFDIRAEYRGFVLKAPDFGLSFLNTNRYEVISIPAIGVAYHF